METEKPIAFYLGGIIAREKTAMKTSVDKSAAFFN